MRSLLLKALTGSSQFIAFRPDIADSATRCRKICSLHGKIEYLKFHSWDIRNSQKVGLMDESYVCLGIAAIAPTLLFSIHLIHLRTWHLSSRRDNTATNVFCNFSNFRNFMIVNIETSISCRKTENSSVNAIMQCLRRHLELDWPRWGPRWLHSVIWLIVAN